MLGTNNPWVIGTKWDGFFSQKAGGLIDENPHSDELLNRLWSSGFSSALSGQQFVSGNFESYWFSRDNDSTDAYKIHYGCAFLGQGNIVAEVSTLDLARELVPMGVRIYHITPAKYPGLFKLGKYTRGRKPTVAVGLG